MRIIAINLIEMAGAGDIVGISIPFTAGVATAAFIQWEPDVMYALAGTAGVLLPLLLAAFCRKGNSRTTAYLIFFLAGVLCSCVQKITGYGWTRTPEAASILMDRFCTLIDRTGFDGDNTGALLKALFTGRREALPASTVIAFRKSGAAHILALSGLHMGIIYGILSKVLEISGNSRPASTIRSIVIITAAGAYTLATGSGPSLVRAFLFIVLNEFARLHPGRSRSPLSILCAALTMQLCFNPLVIKSLGFQLSYLAMAGIFIIYPELEGWYPGESGLDPMRRIWRSAALSVSCQIFTAPLVWLRFGTMPGYFLLTNLIALPVTEALMVLAVICLATSALGCSPEIFKGPVDWLAGTLVFCLETISEL